MDVERRSEPEEVRDRHRKASESGRGNGGVPFEPDAFVAPPDRHRGKRRKDLPDLDVGFQVVAKLLFCFEGQFRIGDHLYSNVGGNRDRPILP